MTAGNTNVFEQNTKKLLLNRLRSGEGDTIELGLTSRVRQWDKEFDADFQRRRNGGDRRILDLENVEEVWQIDALISNELITLSEDTSDSVELRDGGTVQIESLEDVETVFNDVMRTFDPSVSPAPYQLDYGDTSVDGFISSLSIDEAAIDENGTFLIQFDFAVAKFP